MKNKIEDLRNHLFAAIEGLQDPESGMTTEKALAIAEIGKVIVDSAKTEVLAYRATNGDSGLKDGFIVNGTKLIG